MATQELLLRPSDEVVGHIPTPMDLLQMAVAQNADLDKLTKLMDLKERWEAGEARKAFVSAMAAFKAESVKVTRDKDNLQYKSKYVSLGHLVEVVTPVLSKHGLSVRWDIDQTAGIKVTCIITHAFGHSESVAMVCPPDGSGAKNAIQQIKSSITYAKACTFESICGIASTDANQDDDGNGAYAEDLDWISQAGDVEELTRLFNYAFKKAQADKDKNALGALVIARDKRKKELAS